MKTRFILTILFFILTLSMTGKISEYGQIEETFSFLALGTMLNWLKKVTE